MADFIVPGERVLSPNLLTMSEVVLVVGLGWGGLRSGVRNLGFSWLACIYTIILWKSSDKNY